MSLHACAIATPDHLPRARVLARSLREHHPDARVSVLVLGGGAADEPFEVLAPEALGCLELEAMTAAYDPFALACALKPWLMLHLLEQSPAVLYLDSDLRVYASLEGAHAAAKRHGLVLTRHLYGPLPRDGRTPAEEDVLLAGALNAGFVGVSRTPDVWTFLRWWAARLAEDCCVDPARGLFVDQRWLDLAPGFVPGACVIHDPGLNLGVWDLPNRPVTGEPGAYAVGDGPLRCFHFSGFDPERPSVLSVHQNRVDLADHPVLAGLCRDYASELLAEGGAAASAPPGAFGTPLMRRLYREGRAGGALREPLSSPAGQAALVAWLSEPATRGDWAGLTRHLLALHAATPYLRAEFPDLDGPDALAYAEWARAHAGEHPELPAALAPARITLPDGRPLNPLLLALFGERGVPMPEFLAWLAEPAPEGAEAGATRYLFEVHRARADLRAAFPAVGPELVAWARTTGVHEHPLLAELLYASPERAGAGSLA
jgi:hypothetical protein